MANRERHVRIYDLHSWTGIVLAVIMFFVCFTGSMALFHHEIEPWEDEAKRAELSANPIPIHDKLTQWVASKQDGREITFLGVSFPGEDHGYYQTGVSFRDEDGEFEFEQARWDSADGTILPFRETGAAQLIFDLHRDLAWPDMLGGRQIGRALVGVVGIAFLLLILTGIIAHTKITKEMFTLRYLKSVRLKWQDSHKVLGLWTTPFATMIALTGAFLGIVTILLPLVAFVTVKGDEEKLVKELGLGNTPAAEVSATMLSIDEVAPRKHPKTGQPLESVFIANWGDANAEYTFNYPVNDRLTFGDQLKISGTTGESIENRDVFVVGGPYARVLAAFTPLHYGTYGGIALKLLYFVLGMSLAIMSALGGMMWLERRRHGGEGSMSARYYNTLSAINTGVCAGLPFASFAILGLDKLYWGAEAARYSSMIWLFFGIWLATGIFAFFRGSDYKAARELLGATGIVCLALAPLNWILTGDTMWTSFNGATAPSAWFDLVFIVLGAGAFYVASKMPSSRPEDKRRAKKRAAQPESLNTELLPAE